MREIKFRAWDTEYGGFQYSENMNGTDRDCEGGWWGDCILDYKIQYPILQQYTGLKDKNGKEIYEGDILENKNYNKNTVGFRTIVEWMEEGYWSFNSCSINMNIENNIHELVVVGNIYENIELVKE
jgi:uncharacterized phage protein (TIGR01671 family)